MATIKFPRIRWVRTPLPTGGNASDQQGTITTLVTGINLGRRDIT